MPVRPKEHRDMGCEHYNNSDAWIVFGASAALKLKSTQLCTEQYNSKMVVW